MASRVFPVRILRTGTCETARVTAWSASKPPAPQERRPRHPPPACPHRRRTVAPGGGPSPRFDPPRNARGDCGARIASRHRIPTGTRSR